MSRLDRLENIDRNFNLDLYKKKHNEKLKKLIGKTVSKEDLKLSKNHSILLIDQYKKEKEDKKQARLDKRRARRNSIMESSMGQSP